MLTVSFMGIKMKTFPRLLNFRLENIQFHIDLSSEDQSIIYYVAAAISRSIIKKRKCEQCTELLSAGNLEKKFFSD